MFAVRKHQPRGGGRCDSGDSPCFWLGFVWKESHQCQAKSSTLFLAAVTKWQCRTLARSLGESALEELASIPSDIQPQFSRDLAENDPGHPEHSRQRLTTLIHFLLSLSYPTAYRKLVQTSIPSNWRFDINNTIHSSAEAAAEATATAPNNSTANNNTTSPKRIGFSHSIRFSN